MKLSLDPPILTAFPRRIAFAIRRRLAPEGSPSGRSAPTPGSAPDAETLASSGGSRLRALRGATTVAENDADAILDGTEELVREVMQRNDLHPDDMVSCIFTCTNDLDAEFPAVAARRLGLSGVPLLCAREIDVPGALPRAIRLLLHYYGEPEAEVKHVYLREAKELRRDLEAAQ